MTTYYWESETDCGTFECATDAQAREISKSIKNLWVLYKDNQETKDGSFVILIER